MLIVTSVCLLRVKGIIFIRFFSSLLFVIFSLCKMFTLCTIYDSKDIKLIPLLRTVQFRWLYWHPQLQETNFSRLLLVRLAVSVECNHVWEIMVS